MAFEKSMEKIVALSKNRGFIYPGSEIYGGLANAWDYGPLGVELKNNVKKAWWQKFVQENPHNVGVDCAILMNPQVWVASGHVQGFSDPKADCKDCKPATELIPSLTIGIKKTILIKVLKAGRLNSCQIILNQIKFRVQNADH